MLKDYSPKASRGPSQAWRQGRTPMPFGTPIDVANKQWAQDDARGSSAIPPMIPVQIGPGQTVMAPNPAFGQAFGLRWDGSGWTRPDPNLDLQRKLMEMQVQQRQQEMAQEQWRREQERSATEYFMRQQMDPSKQLALSPEPSPTQPPVAGRFTGGMAEPITPPNDGTPYGQQGEDKEWWHHIGTRQEMQLPTGSPAPPGWTRGRLSGSMASGGLRDRPGPGTPQNGQMYNGRKVYW